MSELELPELEDLEEKAQNREHKRIGLIISVIAIFLAVCGALSHKAHNHEIVAGVNASNTWAYFQAKKLRAYQSETGLDLIRLIAKGRAASSNGAEALVRKYADNQGRYEVEAKEIAEKAEAHARAAEHWETRANRFDLAEIFLQIAVVLCSVCILTNSRLFLYGGLGFALLGIILGATGLVI